MTTASVHHVTGFGLDVDHVRAADEHIGHRVSRRIDGRYVIDAFGADPLLMDAATGVLEAAMRVEVVHGDRLPRSGPAVLVANRGLGVLEPAALALAVRSEVGRRIRAVAAPDVPVLGPLARKFGGIGAIADDLGAALRAGYLVAVPLGNTWMRVGAGEPPLHLLTAAVGTPVLPVAVQPVGPLGIPLRGWRVTFGTPIALEPGLPDRDPLAAAELAESAREGVESLLEMDHHPAGG